MKKITALFSLVFALLICTQSKSQDKSKRPSPPAIVKQTLANGSEITIDYSQPSLKGRTIGKDIEPKLDEVWRTGANEATVFETTKAIKINGKELPAGKYGLFSIMGKDGWTIIFNKTWKQWGAYDYKQEDDVLRIETKENFSETVTEKMTFTIDEKGLVTLLWGNKKISFTIE
ncbi:MAG: DUF2911 domain-containing protein [Chitinophagaceae bacterium]